MNSTFGRSLCSLGLLVVLPALALAQQDSARASRRLAGLVVDAETSEPVMGVRVELVATGRVDETDRQGEFAFADIAGDTVDLRAWRLGYAILDTTLILPSNRARLTLLLRARPVELGPLTARAKQPPGGAGRERSLFDREIVPGVVGMSGGELRRLPAVAEPDVLRSIQVLPGVVFLNDLSARLHVRGGGPDQNLFRVDGARVFAPYHMFGMLGAFNTDAIARAELYRGSLPARFGGALSSVIDLQQQDGAAGGRRYEGGLSALGLRVMARDVLPSENASWMFAARRTHLDVIAGDLLGHDFPYAFHDVNARITLQPRPDHRVRASFFTSSDRFRLFLEGDSDRMASRWRNAATSVRWERSAAGVWGLVGEAWGSHYDATLVAGTGDEAPSTSNAIDVVGLRLEAARRGERVGLRAGLDLEAGRVTLLGSDRAGGYVEGDTRDTYEQLAAYIEGEAWLGPLRVGPGLRATILPGGSAVVAPRVAGRLHMSDDMALTVGVGRAYQSLSTLRDDRYPLPGAPFWFLHPPSRPASRADGASVGFEGWVDRTWSFSLTAYAREFAGVPRWRPTGERDISRVAFDDGRAEGVEVFVRRHVPPVTGWIGYGFGRVQLAESDTGRPYAPTWDRRHSLDLALLGHIGTDVTVSSRLAYGSGVPFWPLAGENDGLRFDPLQGKVQLGDSYPVWASEQMRFPAYARVDLGLRYRFTWGSVEIEPHLDLLNVTGRPNVLYYDLTLDGPPPDGNAVSRAILEPVALPAFTVPSLGFHVRF